MSRPGLFHGVERIVLCLSLCSLLTATAYAQIISPASTSTRRHIFRGVYGMGAASNVLNKSYVDGILLWQKWSDIEPQQGSFSWSKLDSSIAATTKAGKHFTLTVAAGINTPRWVYGLGAASVTLSRGTVPIPWDPTYLQYFKGMVAALAARYGRNPALDGVQLTGVNYQYGETGLVGGGNLNDCARWMQVGYTSTSVVSAFSQILNEFNDDFPGVQLAAALIPFSFCLNANTYNNTMNATLLALGGFVPQNTGWNGHWIALGMTGDQEVAPLGSSLPSALELALAQPDTRYLQFYNADLTNSRLTGSIETARAALLAR